MLLAARRSPDTAFGPAVPVSDPSHGAEESRVELSAGGDALAVWQDGTPSETRIGFAVDDVTPPVLTGLVVPATVQVGSAASMSAAATDTWSAPAALAWAFGDDATASGGDVTHTYATAGPQTVTITATDGVGNVATVTRAVDVTPVPGGGVPGGGGVPDGGGAAGGGGVPDGGGAASGGATSGGAAGGAATPGAGLPPVKLSVSLRKQSWRTIRRARAVTLRCRLDVAGRCRATATVSRAVARRLRLKIGAGAAALTVGTRSTTVRRGRFSTLRIVLTRRIRAAFARSRRSIPLRLRVTGTASGRRAASVTRSFTIRR